MGGHTKQSRAKLTFPVSRFAKKLRLKKVTKNLSETAPVFLAGVVENVIMHVVNTAAVDARSRDSTRVNLVDVVAAVRKDVDLARLFAGFAFSSPTNCPKAMNQILPAKEQMERRANLKIVAAKAFAARAVAKEKNAAAKAAAALADESDDDEAVA